MLHIRSDLPEFLFFGASLVPPIWAARRALQNFSLRARPFQFGLSELLLLSILIPLATLAFRHSEHPLIIAALIIYQIAFALWLWTRDLPGEMSSILLLLGGIILGSIVFALWCCLLFLLLALFIGLVSH